MLVLVSLLKRGLYQRTLLRFQFLHLLALAGSYCRVLWYPLSSSAFWYGGAAWSKDALSDDMGGSSYLMPAGMFSVVMCGWFLSRWAYCSEVFGFVNGWKLFG